MRAKEDLAMITRTSSEAQNEFSQLLDTVQREPVAITSNGQTTAFLVSAQDMEEIVKEQERRRQAMRDLDVWREMALKNMTPAAVALTDEEVNRLVHELR